MNNERPTNEPVMIGVADHQRRHDAGRGWR
jgi:hypothetical protein